MHEFQMALQKMSVKQENIDQVFEAIDANHDGYIDYAEFVQACLDAFSRSDEKPLLRVDTDGAY